MRLIDADALMERYGEPCHSFLDVIEDMPTIYAVPVVHAKWIAYWIGDAIKPIYRCSNCDRLAVVTKTNYCPKCGARMDGDPDG